jgi:hypothetical protein
MGAMNVVNPNTSDSDATQVAKITLTAICGRSISVATIATSAIGIHCTSVNRTDDGAGERRIVSNAVRAAKYNAAIAPINIHGPKGGCKFVQKFCMLPRSVIERRGNV